MTQSRAPAALAIGILLAAAACSRTDSAGSLTAVSRGGSYAQAVGRAQYDPFEAATGISVVRDDFTGGLAEIRAQVDTGNVFWDVVELELSDSVRACEEGLLEQVPEDLFGSPAETAAAASDFWPEALGECGVGGVVYSTVVAYNRELFPGEPPDAVADFFDLERFPGRRGMRRTPFANIEFALLADGVAASEVYAVLDSQGGLARAFRMLDRIREQIVWWEAGAQPPQMLADAEVAMSTAFNGRIFNAQVLERQPLVIIWDGQVLDLTHNGVLAGAPNREEAFDFLRFASAPESMALLAGEIAYSPTRHSALSLVGAHRETGVPMLPHLPTNPENLHRYVESDWRFWRENFEELNERFSVWLLR